MSCLLPLLSAFRALLILPLVPVVLSQPLRTYCPFTANYTGNSTFHSNLNAVLSSLSSDGPATGFSNAAVGSPPDRVYGLSLCRGDVGADRCQTCLNDAAAGAVRLCRYRKSAAVWYDECLLRYSDRAFFSTVDTSFIFDVPNPNNASQPAQFGQSLAELMDSLTATAANGQPRRMFAARGVALNGTDKKVYGLEQCTRDLSGDQCGDCLGRLRSRILACCSGKEGGRVFSLSCVLRFEVFQFYDPSTGDTPSSQPPLVEQPPVSPAPPTAELSPVAPSVPPGKKEKKNGALILAITVVLPILFLSMAGISGYMWMRRRGKTVANAFDGAEGDEVRRDESMSFDVRILRSATNNFSYENKLGEGGFGPVYKGVLPNGQHVAIKMLSRSSRQGLTQLKTEMAVLGKLQHRNLVRLFGYCLKEHASLLVYEYLPNRSLDRFLFDPMRSKQLNWEKRYKIIEGVTRGLLYLHEDSRLRVIHRDLKAANILLDGDMNPKISDFGLARLFGIDQTQGNTSRVVGTLGYMAPEYAVHGHYSNKSDVYSFGILVLEIITGRQSIGFRGSGRAATLSGYVWQHWVEESLTEILDQSIIEGCLMEEASRCVRIGLLCVQEDPFRRPSMASVLLMLNSGVITTQTLSEPAFFTLGGQNTGSNSSATEQELGSSRNQSSHQYTAEPTAQDEQLRK